MLRVADLRGVHFTGDPTPLARDNIANIVFRVCVSSSRTQVHHMLHQNEQCYSDLQTDLKLFWQIKQKFSFFHLLFEY